MTYIYVFNYDIGDNSFSPKHAYITKNPVLYYVEKKDFSYMKMGKK